MSTPANNLLLIDVMPLLYRGHFAFVSRPRLTSAGVNTSAIFIFTSLVLQMLDDEKATHAALAMDTSPTFRHERFPAYKAQRDKLPEDIAASIPMAEEFAHAMNLPFIRIAGYEADDVIGTLAARGEAAGMRVSLFTPDKDFAQLVTPHTTLFRPGKGDVARERYGVAEVCESWELSSPAQMIELLGLAGDASDNIPGIPGVGPKTAVKLLQEYGSIEGVIANAAQLKGKLGERLREHAEDARLSRWLATIARDAPIEATLDDLRIRDLNPGAVAEFCQKYELLSLSQRLLKDYQPTAAPASPGVADDLPLFAASADAPSPAPASTTTPAAAHNDLPLLTALNIDMPPQPGTIPLPALAQAAPAASPPLPGDATLSGFQTLADLSHNYRICQSDAERRTMLAELNAAAAWAFDTETTGLDVWSDRLIGLSFCATPGQAWYLPLPSDQAEAAGILAALQPLFSNPDSLKIAHNLKFDLAFLRQAGVEVSGPFFDTMLAHYVIDPASRHGIDHLAKSLLNYEPIPILSLIGPRGPEQLTMDALPLAEVATYAAEDADVTLRLQQYLAPAVREAKATAALERCENALVPVLLDMESEGVRVNDTALNMYSSELAVEVAELEKKIHAAAGTHFNIASPKQLGEVLFSDLKLPPAGRTPTGQYETSEEVLLGLKGQHPIIDLILEYRTCTKLKSTYVDKLPQWIRPETGRIHSSFNQALTETGRLSSDNPNLQNIPIRTERGRRIRAAFIARDADHVLLSADYSQIELRMMAALSGDAGLLEAFRNDSDIHTETAARVHGIEATFVTPAMRDQAKMVNFGIIYGISAYGLSQRLGIPRKQAAELIEAYFKMYPAVQDYMDRTVAEAREKGYVTTLLGRRRPLRDIASRNNTLRSSAERIAINTPVQGSAADLIKLAMVAIHSDLCEQQLKARLVLQVHDELVLDVPRAEIDTVSRIVTERMTHALDLPVPLKVDLGTGSNWLEAH